MCLVQKETKQGNNSIFSQCNLYNKTPGILSTYFFKNILKGNLICILCMNQADLLCCMVFVPITLLLQQTDPSDLKHLEKTLYTIT